jgi:hypothetical protein
VAGLPQGTRNIMACIVGKGKNITGKARKNPKREIRNSKQIQNPNDQKYQHNKITWSVLYILVLSHLILFRI